MQSLEQLKLVSAFYPLNIDFFLPSHFFKNAGFEWQAHKDNKNCKQRWHIFTCTWHFPCSKLCSTCFTCSSSFKLITHLWIGIVFITILPWENKGTKKKEVTWPSFPNYQLYEYIKSGKWFPFPGQLCPYSSALWHHLFFSIPYHILFNFICIS